MSFLTPAFLFGALAVAIPIVLHFLRRERLPRVSFSDVRLLRGARLDQTRRQRLRELLLLALRVAALLLLALAFARPFVADRGAAGEGATVVLVDTSFSVSAPGQAAEVRALARAAIDAAPEGRLVGVVAFDDAARVVAPLAAGRASAHAAVDGLSPRPRATRYRDGLAAASALIGDRPGRVVVVTDLQAGGWEAGTGRLAPHGDVGVVDAGVGRGWEAGTGRLAPHIEVETRRVAAPAGNLAVVGLDREPSGVAVRLSRWGDGGERARLTIEVDGVAVDQSVHRVEAGESTVRRPLVLPASGVVTAAVSDSAGYPADDRRYRRLEPADAAGVLLVADEGGRPELYLRRALSPGDGAGRFTVATAAASELGPPSESGQRPDPLAEASVVVLTGARGLGRAGRDRLAAFVRGGGGLLAVGGPAGAAAARAGLLGAGAGPQPSETRAHDDPLALVTSDRRHPLVRALGGLAGRLGRSRFTRSAGLDAADGGVVFSFTDGAPALVEHAAGAGRIFVFAADLRNDGNDLPRQAEFVPFVHEMVGYLAVRPARPREFVVGAAPSGAPSEPGPARLPGGDGPVVLNVDTRESAFEPLSDEAFLASVERFAGTAHPESAPSAGEAATPDDPAPPREEAEQALWRYLLIGMALLLVAEGMLAARMP